MPIYVGDFSIEGDTYKFDVKYTLRFDDLEPTNSEDWLHTESVVSMNQLPMTIKKFDKIVQTTVKSARSEKLRKYAEDLSHHQVPEEEE